MGNTKKNERSIEMMLRDEALSGFKVKPITPHSPMEYLAATNLNAEAHNEKEHINRTMRSEEHRNHKHYQKKVLHLMINDGFGGMEQAFLDYTHALQTFCNVLTVVNSKAGMLDKFQYSADEVALLEYGFSFWHRMKAASQLLEMLRKFQPDVIIAHGRHSLIVSRLSLMFYKKPTIFIPVRHTMYSSKISAWAWSLYSDRVIGVNKLIASQAGTKGVCIYNIASIPQSNRPTENAEETKGKERAAGSRMILNIEEKQTKKQDLKTGSGTIVTDELRDSQSIAYDRADDQYPANDHNSLHDQRLSTYYYAAEDHANIEQQVTTIGRVDGETVVPSRCSSDRLPLPYGPHLSVPAPRLKKGSDVRCEEAVNLNVKSHDEWLQKKPNLEAKTEHKVQGTIRIGFLGRLVKNKGVQYLIRAIGVLAMRMGMDCKLIIGGDGKYAKVIKKHIFWHNLEDRVEMLGLVHDKNKFFADIDIFCLPSLQEAFGIVILEAMARKVPVIASNIDGITDIMQHEVNGLLFKAGDHYGLAHAIECMVHNPDERKRYVTNAYNDCLNQFSMDRLIDNLREVILPDDVA